MFVGGIERARVDFLLKINAGACLDEEGGIVIDDVLEGDDSGGALKGVREAGLVVDAEVKALVIGTQPQEPLAALDIGPGEEIERDAAVEFEVVMLDLHVAAAALEVLVEAVVGGGNDGVQGGRDALDGLDRLVLAGGGKGGRAGK